MKPAMLIMDIQNDFTQPDGRKRVSDNHIEPMLSNTNRVIEAFASRGWPIVYVANEFEKRQWIGYWGRRYAAMKGTEGAELDSRLTVKENGIYLPKRTASAFVNPRLQKEHGRYGANALVMVGLCARC